MPIEANGRILKLSDFAEIRRGYEDPQEFTDSLQRTIGHRARRGDEQRRQCTRARRAASGNGGRSKASPACWRRMDPIAFQPTVVDESVHEFLQSFVEALVIVLAVSFLSWV